MGKKKKIGIKTSRYYTKHCTKCSYEYPSWFTNCPKCGTAWDNSEINLSSDEILSKTIKIVVKITEEDFNESINYVELFFSGDQGKSWYKTKMDNKMDYFIAEITDIPVGSVIIYYIEVYLASGEKFIENNDGNYFYYKVGVSTDESEEKPPESETQLIQENITRSTQIPRDYNEIIKQDQTDNEIIYGKPQNNFNSDLKVCPRCSSKIKKIRDSCPICGYQL
ncbi:MAG: hypothetical protein ACFFAN_01195 [Promethearchaeota archaeon]